MGYSWHKTIQTTWASGFLKDHCTYRKEGAGCGISAATVIYGLGFGAMGSTV